MPALVAVPALELLPAVPVTLPAEPPSPGIGEPVSEQPASKAAQHTK
jgi:hypothetical protein